MRKLLRGWGFKLILGKARKAKLGRVVGSSKEKKDDDLGGNIWEFVDEGLTGTLAGDPAGISPHSHPPRGQSRLRVIESGSARQGSTTSRTSAQCS